MKPEKTTKGLTFLPIPEVDDATMVFGLGEKSYFKRNSLPKVPDKYEDIVSSIFYSGGVLPELSKEVDRTKTVRYLRALLCSFDPPHESKIATAAYALWVWTEA